jgi:hypothetical protein
VSTAITDAAFAASLTALAALGCVRSCTLNGQTFRAVRSAPQADPAMAEALGNHDGVQFALRFTKADAGYSGTDAPSMPADCRIMVQDGDGAALMRPYRIVGWECGANTIRVRCGEALQ